MITATDCVVYVIACNRCQAEEWLTLPAGASACDAEDDARRSGWAVGDEHVCLSCQADEGLTVAQIAADYRSSPVDDLEAHR